MTTRIAGFRDLGGIHIPSTGGDERVNGAPCPAPGSAGFPPVTRGMSDAEEAGMAKTRRDPFETIETGKLDTVSGGRSIARSSSAVAAGGGGDLLTELTNIETQLSALQMQNPFMEMLQLWEMMQGATPKLATAKPAAATTLSPTHASSAQQRYWKASRK